MPTLECRLKCVPELRWCCKINCAESMQCGGQKKKTRPKNVVYIFFEMIFKNVFFVIFFSKIPSLALINTTLVLIRAKVGKFQNFPKKVTDFFSKSIFSTMKKYFSSGFFLNLKSYLSAFQRTQPELLGVSVRETAPETKQWPPPWRRFSNHRLHLE